MRLAELQTALQRKVPNAKLECVRLPQVPEIKLSLIAASYPQAELSSEQVYELMDNPPYWAFCWASGQVMARHLLDKPHLVAGKTVIDFGSGSGVVAIAAALAGADESIAVDTDPHALIATSINAALNKCKLTICDDLASIHVRKSDTGTDKSDCIILIADVFYDAENIPLLAEFIEHYQDVIIADSRVTPSSLTGMYEEARYASCTVPDLDESRAFNSVGLYRSCPQT